MNFEKEWTVYRTRFLVRACQLTEPVCFTDALGREHSGAPGDYLVESSEGCLRITPQRIFEDVYVALDVPPPSAVSVQSSSIETELRQRRSPGETQTYAIREVVENSVHASA